MLSRLTYSHLYHGIFAFPVAITINGILLHPFPFVPIFNLFSLITFYHLVTILPRILDNVVSLETVQVPSSSGSFTSNVVG